MITPYAEPKGGPRAKIERAKEHLAELERAIVGIHGGADLYTVVAQEELQDGHKIRVFRFKVKQSAPARLSTIAGDIIHNTRSALDLIACQCLNPGANIEHCKFPFGKDKNIFESELKQQLKYIRPDAVRFIKRLKPYKGGDGNRTLWLLHTLDLMDKHRLLIMVGAVNRKTLIIPSLGLKPGDQVSALKLTIKREGLLKNGDELFRSAILAPTFDKALKYDFRFEIRLGSIEGLPEESAVNLLGHFVAYVQKIITIAEKRLY